MGLKKNRLVNKPHIQLCELDISEEGLKVHLKGYGWIMPEEQPTVREREHKEAVIFHTDCGSQYTSHEFKALCKRLNITQSMRLARLSCYGNAKCESIFARFKEEAIYGRYDTAKMSMDEVKRLIFRYRCCIIKLNMKSSSC